MFLKVPKNRQANLGQRYRPGSRGGGPVEIMEVFKDGGTQYPRRAGKTVIGYGSTTCGV
ncbi:hypothetical protein DPMN_096049 [Dreissena polymorpha]|uniref:Uncharacterized protein n=1 Tax=Dreissena polymorpha TaxID=45954 RepID=A0A9D4L918_DREPO|nr:hypothetical protein DPMN_096049 [Dreissena polymorpha]